MQGTDSVIVWCRWFGHRPRSKSIIKSVPMVGPKRHVMRIRDRGSETSGTCSPNNGLLSDLITILVLCSPVVVGPTIKLSMRRPRLSWRRSRWRTEGTKRTMCLLPAQRDQQAGWACIFLFLILLRCRVSDWLIGFVSWHQSNSASRVLSVLCLKVMQFIARGHRVCVFLVYNRYMKFLTCYLGTCNCYSNPPPVAKRHGQYHIPPPYYWSIITLYPITLPHRPSKIGERILA